MNLPVFFIISIILGESGPVQQQGLRGPVGLLEVRDMGHHRGASLPQRAQRIPTNGDRHHVLHHNSSQDSVLHGELDFAHRPHLLSLRPSVLFTGRSR